MGARSPTNQTEMNRHIKQIEAHFDAIKSQITHLYERAAESEINPHDNKPSSLIFESLLNKMGANS